jgi:Calcium-binding EGF domain/EGF domain
LRQLNRQAWIGVAFALALAIPAGCGPSGEASGAGSTSAGQGGAGGSGAPGKDMTASVNGASSAAGMASTTASGSTGGQGGGNDVDACKDGSAQCDKHAICIDLALGYSCKCIAGYQGNGFSCADIDECLTATDDCDPVAACTNTAGGFTCACPDGYADPDGAGKTCTDIDECASHAAGCDPVALCANTPGRYTCACPQGFADTHGDGTRCAVDLSVGDTCNNPFVIAPGSLPARFTGNTTAATPLYGHGQGACPGEPESGGAGASDRVYSLTPAVSGTYALYLTSQGWDATLYAVTDCAAINGSCLGAVDQHCSGCGEPLEVTLDAGKTYFFIVDGSSDTANDFGAYTLEVIPPKSFVSPIQLDVAKVLFHDTVVNNGKGTLDPTQTSMDASGFAFLTQSVATALGGPAGNGLPDDGRFPANADHPDVKLHFRNDDDGLNSRVLRAGESFSFAVPVASYQEVQIYALSAEGKSAVKLTLTYADATTEARQVTLGDWFDDPSPAGQFFLVDGLDRFGAGGYVAAHDPAISAVNLAPNPQKKLASVTVAGQGAGIVTFYGATAW